MLLALTFAIITSPAAPSAEDVPAPLDAPVAVVLPSSIDPTGRTRMLHHGTRIYVDRRPRVLVDYRSMSTDGKFVNNSEDVPSVVKIERTAAAIILVLSDGTNRTYPRDAIVDEHPRFFAAYLAAPGMPGLPGRMPDYVVP